MLVPLGREVVTAVDKTRQAFSDGEPAWEGDEGKRVGDGGNNGLLPTRGRGDAVRPVREKVRAAGQIENSLDTN